MKIARLPLLLASVGLLALAPACSSSSTSSGGTGGEQDPGATGTGGTAAAAPDANPEGVPYPTSNIGLNSRAGEVPGNTIQNYKFLGYPDGDVSKGLQPMSLANFFDPTGTKYKLIRIQASGSWCSVCQKETEAVNTLPAQLAERKVAYLISLAEGPIQGTAATKGDLDQWIANFKAPYPHLLDPGNRNLGVFYNSAALPWNGTINAKTMEILNTSLGSTGEPKSILSEIDGFLSVVDETN